MAEHKLNIELFKKVRERIANVPDSYRQSVWVESSSRSPCGTVACLAGETVICAAPSVEQGIAELRALAENDEVAQRAGELLGLGREYYYSTSDTIFDEDANGWPQSYRDMFRDGNRVKAAIAFLDHVIKTGRID